VSIYDTGPAESAVSHLQALWRELERRGLVIQRLTATRGVARRYDHHRTAENLAALRKECDRLEYALFAYQAEAIRLSQEVSRFASQVDNYVLPENPVVQPEYLWEDIELRLRDV
jgi:hypothetical protein